MEYTTLDIIKYLSFPQILNYCNLNQDLKKLCLKEPLLSAILHKESQFKTRKLNSKRGSKLIGRAILAEGGNSVDVERALNGLLRMSSYSGENTEGPQLLYLVAPNKDIVQFSNANILHLFKIYFIGYEDHYGVTIEGGSSLDVEPTAKEIIYVMRQSLANDGIYQSDSGNYYVVYPENIASVAANPSQLMDKFLDVNYSNNAWVFEYSGILLRLKDGSLYRYKVARPAEIPDGLEAKKRIAVPIGKINLPAGFLEKIPEYLKLQQSQTAIDAGSIKYTFYSIDYPFGIIIYSAGDKTQEPQDQNMAIDVQWIHKNLGSLVVAPIVKLF